MRHGWAAFSWQGFSGRQKKASRARAHGAPKRDGPWQGFAEKSVSLQSKFPRSKFLKCWGLRFICYTLAGIVLATEGWFGPPPSATAQQVSISTPLVGITESYFESIGTAWGMRGRNWFVRFGGSPLLPGSVAANPGAQLGFAWAKGDCSGYFWAYAAQGCSRSLVGVTPVVMLPSGGVGWVADVAITPFVMGFIPVVGYTPIIGGFPVYVLPWPLCPCYCWPSPDNRCHRCLRHVDWASSLAGLAARERLGEVRGIGGQKGNENFRRAFPQHAREAFPRHDRQAFPQGPWGKGEEPKGVPPANQAALVGEKDNIRQFPLGLPGLFLPSDPQVSDPRRTAGPQREITGTGTPQLSQREKVLADSRSSAELPVPSVTELAALRAQELARLEKEARELLERGQKAQEEGRTAVAKVYYQMAVRKSSGIVREAALTALATLEGKRNTGDSQPSSVAQQESPGLLTSSLR
jgi:hypothetical protein